MDLDQFSKNLEVNKLIKELAEREEREDKKLINKHQGVSLCVLRHHEPVHSQKECESSVKKCKIYQEI